MHSPDFVKENIAKLADLFPGCVTESTDENGCLKKAIDFDLLRQELSPSIVEGPQERYQLNWPGKRDALLAANAPIAKTLRPCRGKSVEFEDTRNLFIEGDNLDALKLLQENYLSKIKLIYIDPPYNTGNDFIYEDNFNTSQADHEEASGQRDSKGGRLVANTESNGRFHSAWLSMMYPRLKLASYLLKEDGAIFISIDDGEVASLRKLCDEVFGTDNFIATIIWQKVFSPKNSARHFSEDHDFIVVYAKNKNLWTPNQLPRTVEQNKLYKNPDNDPRGPWTSGDLTARNYYGDGQYEVTGPTGKKFTSGKGRYWRSNYKIFCKLDADNRVWWGKDGENMPRLKRFLSEVSDGRVPQTLWAYKEVGHTQDAKKELLKYVEFEKTENVLNSVKPTSLIQKIIHIATNSTDGEIILDFFAGSGPSAHAVVNQNINDKGNRKFILIQIDEILPKPESIAKTISDLTISRLKNIHAECNSDRRNIDAGFRFLKIDSSNMADVYYAPDAVEQNLLTLQTENIKEDRTSEDLLFQVLLDWGVDLTLPISKEIIRIQKDEGGRMKDETGDIEGSSFILPPSAFQEFEVFFVDGNALAACFEKDGKITEDFCKELAGRQPLRVVFRDAGFKDDSVKINVEQIFKLMSPHTDVKTI